VLIDAPLGCPRQLMVDSIAYPILRDLVGDLVDVFHFDGLLVHTWVVHDRVRHLEVALQRLFYFLEEVESFRVFSDVEQHDVAA